MNVFATLLTTSLNVFLVYSDFVMQEICAQDPEGFAIHELTASKKLCTVLVALEPHYEWSSDGHNKLSKIGFQYG